jgi:hypothetical protein
MEKEQQPIADLFIRQCIGFIIYRTIANLILKEIKRYRDLSNSLLMKENDFWIKVAKGAYKKPVVSYIGRLKSQQDDIVAEVMKQYAMILFPDATPYHDILSRIFNEGLGFAKDAIDMGRYDLIVMMSEMTQDGVIERK